MASADYLAKYLSAEDAEQQLGVKKKKRRKKKKAGAAASAAAVKGSSVVIHDENPEWAKAVDAENSDAEDGPVVVELEDATTRLRESLMPDGEQGANPGRLAVLGKE